FAIAAAARARRSVRDTRLAPPSKSTERTMVLLEVDVAKYKARLADIERASVQPNADPADALDLAISCLTEIISIPPESRKEVKPRFDIEASFKKLEAEVEALREEIRLALRRPVPEVQATPPKPQRKPR